MKNIALLIDLENVSPPIIEQTFSLLEPLGNTTIRRAYGDLSNPNSQLLAWKPLCQKYHIELIHHFACKAQKNSSDILLAIDAIDILYQQPVEIFCIVSSDSDFSSLIQRLKRSQRQVIGIGSNEVNENYAQLFEQFHLLHPTTEPTPTTVATPPKKQPLPQRLKAKFAPFTRLFTPQPRPQIQVVIDADLPAEQSLIKEVYKKARKDHEGYVLQAIFASTLSEEQRKFIKNKYKTIGKFAQQSPHLSRKRDPKDAHQWRIKPKFPL